MPRGKRDSEEFWWDDDELSVDSDNSSDREFEKKLMDHDPAPKTEKSEPVEENLLWQEGTTTLKHAIENIIAHRTRKIHKEWLEDEKYNVDHKINSQDSNIDIQDILEENEKEKEKYKEDQVEEEVKLDHGNLKIQKKKKNKVQTKEEEVIEKREIEEEKTVKREIKEEKDKIDDIQEKDINETSEYDDSEYMFLVKFVNMSYLHVIWMTEQEILDHSEEGEVKLKRYKSRMSKNGGLQLTQWYFDEAFDPSYIQVERIVFTTNLFPVVHPRQAKQTKGTWYEDIQHVMLILLNIKKDTHALGLYWLDINFDPKLDTTRKENPDFLLILNRCYNKIYKTPLDFWKELGNLLKNFRRENMKGSRFMRQVWNYLRELSYFLYKKWHSKASQKHKEYISHSNNHTII